MIATALYLLLAAIGLWAIHELGHALIIEVALGRPTTIVIEGMGGGVGWDIAGVGRAGALGSLAGPAASLTTGAILIRLQPIPHATWIGVYSIVALGLLQLVPVAGQTDGAHAIAFLTGRLGR